MKKVLILSIVLGLLTTGAILLFEISAKQNYPPGCADCPDIIHFRGFPFPVCERFIGFGLVSKCYWNILIWDIVIWIVVWLLINGLVYWLKKRAK